MEFESIVTLIGGLIIITAMIGNIVQAVYLRKSIPLEDLPELFERLRVYANKTETPVDNILIDTAENLVDELTAQPAQG